MTHTIQRRVTHTIQRRVTTSKNRASSSNRLGCSSRATEQARPTSVKSRRWNTLHRVVPGKRHGVRGYGDYGRGYSAGNERLESVNNLPSKQPSSDNCIQLECIHNAVTEIVSCQHMHSITCLTITSTLFVFQTNCVNISDVSPGIMLLLCIIMYPTYVMKTIHVSLNMFVFFCCTSRPYRL